MEHLESTDDDAPPEGGATTDDAPPEESGRRPRRRRIALVVTAVVLVWLALAAYQLLAAGLAARSGMDAMESVRSVASEDVGTLMDSLGGTEDDVDEEAAGPALLRSAEEFESANNHVTSPIVAPLFYAPVIGRQLRSVKALSEAATTTASEAGHAVTELETLLESSTATGNTRLAAIEEAEVVLTELEAGIDDLDLGPTEGLLPPLARAHNRFAVEYDRVTETLSATTAAVAGVSDLLAGPSRYLLLAANNAEMRAGSGMVLQAGAMDLTDGVFSVEELTATEDLALDSPAATLDPDIEALWGTLQPSVDWRNLNLSPRFDETATTAAAMWSASGGGEVDGVIAVDVAGIARLLEVTGPVTLESGETITAESVQQDLLVDQYRTYGEDRTARRDRLGDVAQAAFDAINDRPVSASDLMHALRDLGAGRHLLMWSSEPRQAEAWEALGTDGVPTEDALMLSVMNRGGNKMDPYLGVRSAMETTVVDDLRHVVIDVDLANNGSGNLPGYVSGPYPGLDLAPEEYKGIVSMTLPASAGNTSISGGVPAALGNDGPNRVAATEVRLQRGESTTVRFEFDLPLAQQSVEVLAGARIPATEWTVGSETFTDDFPHRIDLESSG